MKVHEVKREADRTLAPRLYLHLHDGSVLRESRSPPSHLYGVVTKTSLPDRRDPKTYQNGNRSLCLPNRLSPERELGMRTSQETFRMSHPSRSPISIVLNPTGWRSTHECERSFKHERPEGLAVTPRTRWTSEDGSVPKIRVCVDTDHSSQIENTTHSKTTRGTDHSSSNIDKFQLAWGFYLYCEDPACFDTLRYPPSPLLFTNPITPSPSALFSVVPIRTTVSLWLPFSGTKPSTTLHQDPTSVRSQLTVLFSYTISSVRQLGSKSSADPTSVSNVFRT